MIKKISMEELARCLDIVKTSYEDIAIKFGMTEDNCPYRGRTCLPFHIFENEFNEGYLMYSYFYDNDIVGFLSLIASGNEMKIHDLAILPSYQNKGFGSELIQFSKEKAKELKCSKITLGMVHENIALKNWYEKIGFNTVNLLKFDKVTYTVGIMELLL